jgi:DNA-binding NtrC family response regulator
MSADTFHEPIDPSKSPAGSILIVDDTSTNLHVLVDYFADLGFDVLVATDGSAALEQMAHVKPEIILLDVMMPGMDGFETCRRLKANPATADIPVIFMTALSDTGDKIRGFEAGAVDYVTKPIQHEEVRARVMTHLALRRMKQRLEEANVSLEHRVAERTAKLQTALAEVESLKNRLQEENRYLQEELKSDHHFQDIVSQTPIMKKLLLRLEQVAPTDSTVLILGESGTGKELFARAIHNVSGRKSRPLVKVNCGAIPAGLVESELFGHEKGAFTNAVDRRTGRFELADGGTIFLDEVGELPLDTQVKLLRVLQEQEFERVGSSRTTKVDVRVLAATNRSLAEAVRDGAFRSDLYYRLNIFPLTIPPLRDRMDDIPLLVQTFLTRFSVKLRKPLERLSGESLTKAMQYSWPGNIRELQNVIERAAILANGPIVEIEDVLESRPMDVSESGPLSTLEEVEKHHILRVLEATHGIIEGAKGAAAILGLNPSTLRSRMQKLGIRKPARIYQ